MHFHIKTTISHRSLLAMIFFQIILFELIAKAQFLHSRGVFGQTEHQVFAFVSHQTKK
jgi:hypothetical protein